MRSLSRCLLLAGLTALVPPESPSSEPLAPAIVERVEVEFLRALELTVQGDAGSLAELESDRWSWFEGLTPDLRMRLAKPDGEDLGRAVLLLAGLDPAFWLPKLTAEEFRDGARRWDPDGRFAVAASAWLVRNGEAARAHAWIARRRVPETDAPLRDVLLVECLDAMGDSVIAGTLALRLANSRPRHPLWGDLALRGGTHLFHHGLVAGAWAMLERRAQRDGESVRSLWLRWRILDHTPSVTGDSERESILGELLDESLNDHQINRLCDDIAKRLEIGWAPPNGDFAEAAGRALVRGRRAESLSLLLRRVSGEGDTAGRVVASAVSFWRRAGRTDRAGALADSFLGSPSAPGADRVLIERARLFRRRGDLELMRGDAERVWQDSDDPLRAGLALWELAREVEDEVGPGDALGLYRRLAGRSRCGSYAGNAALKVGILLLAEGDPDGALSWWDSLGVGPGLTPGSASRNGGTVPGTLDVGLLPESEAAAWYWRGRALERSGRSEDARAAWARAAQSETPSFYGWISERAKAAVERGEGSRSVWADLAREVRLYPEFGPAHAREAVSPDFGAGWTERAARCRIWSEVDNPSWSRREWAETGWGSLERRERVLLHMMCGEESLGLRGALRLRDPEERRRLSHPAPFGGVLTREARRRGVSPFLLWGIMRQESAMDRRAVSRAGAVGLLQLMPTTAAEVAARWGIAAGPLTSPEANVALGAAHLVEALEESLSVPEALAAYNAGPEAVAQWRDRAAEPDLFIERIGYSETRNYVRRVLRDYGVYRRLYGARD